MFKKFHFVLANKFKVFFVVFILITYGLTFRLLYTNKREKEENSTEVNTESVTTEEPSEEKEMQEIAANL